MRLYRLPKAERIEDLTLVEAEPPRPARGQALVRMRAAALNYRDLMVATGRYGRGAGVKPGLVPLSDGAGEVVAVGPEVTRVKPMLPAEARNYLGKFLFSNDDVFRPIETLSGGERGRVALAKLALSGANLLLLDEPTNHLDIDSQEILQNVLAGFDGTILLVSHDRYLIEALATQIWSATPGKLEVFEGTYKEFVAVRDAASAAVAAAAPPKKVEKSASTGTNGSAKKHGLNPYQLAKRVTQVEHQIEQLENRMHEITAGIEQASTAGDAARVQQLGEQYTQAEADLQAAMSEWETLME